MIITALREKRINQKFISYFENSATYDFITILGEGTFGVTYLIFDKKTNKKVVLKRLKTKYAKKRKSLEHFHKEMNCLQKNMHQNFPAFISENTMEEIPYFIMEYKDGKTFEQLIFDEGKVYSTRDTIQIVKQLLKMVMTIHSYGIVHRDLRIPNIIQNNDELSIVDFGLACSIDNEAIINQIKNPKKSASYISDLYHIGHFMLYLLYSTYEISNRKEKSWQEELQLTKDIVDFIEKLLLIQSPFQNALAAYEALNSIE
ncbi:MULTISPECIES: serine/threonine-protein kinase [Bacillus]|uniref:serine/threonine-protein kinase n=1 Tax=Bacillus TaxID=1386 RepID=UPI0002FF5881|nr:MULTISPECIES: protein kinase [Bacillus]